MKTGGQLVVDSLIRHGVTTLFGLPGVQNDWLYNALYERQDEIRVIHTRHEQEAAYMALGYAQATGEIAVFNVVPGPGLLNASAALATAYGLNARVLCLVGQIPTDKIGKGKGVLHELPDQMSILSQLTKYAASANTPDEIPSLIDRAFYELNTGRPRPVGLQIPMDVLKGEGGRMKDETSNLPEIEPWSEFTLVPSETIGGIRMRPIGHKILRAVQALGPSKNPIIYVGGGAQGVSAEVRKLSEMLEAPVVGYRTGMGIADSRHYRSLHMPPSHECWKSADVILLVGTHARIPLQQWGVDERMTIIKVDVDPDAHAVIREPDIALTGRAEHILPLLIEGIADYDHERPSREAELSAIKAEWLERTAYLEPQLGYLKVIREELGEDGIFVDELTQIGFTSRITMPVYHPRTFISTGYMGTLGYGFPTALGVKVARPDVPVVSVAGDGGFMFGVQALATAVQHKISLVVLVFNNNRYGNVQQMQKNLYGGTVIASDLVNPDFVALAQTFGANGLLADSPESLREALRTGFATVDKPTLIEIPCGEMPSIDRFRKLGRVRG